MANVIDLKKHLLKKKIKKDSKKIAIEGVQDLRKMLDEYRIHYQAALMKVVKAGGIELLNDTEKAIYEIYKNETN